MEGTILVDGVLASCYASMENLAGIDGHAISHAGILPVRLAARAKPPKPTEEDVRGIHPYFSLMANLFRPWVRNAN